MPQRSLDDIYNETIGLTPKITSERRSLDNIWNETVEQPLDPWRLAIMGAESLAELYPRWLRKGLYWTMAGPAVRRPGETREQYAERILREAEAEKPKTLPEYLTVGLTQAGRDLPFIAGGIGALRALGLRPIISGMLGIGGYTQLRGTLEGHPIQTLPSALLSGATYPLWHAGARIGRLAPTQWLARPMTAAGMGAVAGTTAQIPKLFGETPPKEETISQTLIGAGLGGLYPERPLTKSELATAERAPYVGERPMGKIETYTRSFIKNLEKYPKNIFSMIAQFASRMPKEDIDTTYEFGIENVDTPINRNPQTARKIIPNILETLQKTKTELGERVSKILDQFRQEPIDVRPLAENLQTNLEAVGLLSPVEIAQLRKVAQAAERPLSQRELSKLFKIDLDEEATTSITKYLMRTFDRLVNIKNINQAKLTMESIANKLESHRGEDISRYENMLWDIYNSLGNLITQAISAKSPRLAQQYQQAKRNYHEFMKDSNLIRKNIVTNPTRKGYWEAVGADELVKRLRNIIEPGSILRQRLENTDPELFNDIRKFLAAQSWRLTDPHIFRGRALNMLASMIFGTSLAGPLGGGIMVLGTLPATYKTLLRTAGLLRYPWQQLTTIRPTEEQVIRYLQKRE